MSLYPYIKRSVQRDFLKFLLNVLYDHRIDHISIKRTVPIKRSVPNLTFCYLLSIPCKSILKPPMKPINGFRALLLCFLINFEC